MTRSADVLRGAVGEDEVGRAAVGRHDAATRRHAGRQHARALGVERRQRYVHAFAPFLESFVSMLGFMKFAGGRVGPLAVATPAMAMTSAHASATATLGLKRIDPPSITWARLPRRTRLSLCLPVPQTVKRE